MSRLIGLLSLAGALACSGRDEGGRLLSADSYDESEEAARLQKMQNIIVTATVNGATVSEEWLMGSTPNFQLAAALSGTDPSCSQTTTCVKSGCWMDRYLEFAQKALNLATEQKTVSGRKSSLYTPWVVGTSTIPVNTAVTISPQDSASNAMFARQAVFAAATSMSYARTILNGDIEEDVDYTTVCSDTAVIQGAAIKFVEAKELLVKAMEVSSQLDLAIADSQLSSTTEISLAQQRSVSGALFSRSAIAHLRVGGLNGIKGSVTSPLCTSPELSSRTKAAIDLIRDAAPSPSTIIQLAISIRADGTGAAAAALDAFVNGTTTEGSLLQRLESFRGIDISTVETTFGIEQEDISAAILYLSDELTAFGRSRTYLVPGTFAFPKYAATAHPPKAPEPAFWTALMRTNHDLDNTSGTTLADSASASRVAAKGTLASTLLSEFGFYGLGSVARVDAEAAAYLAKWLGDSRFAPGTTLGNAVRDRLTRGLGSTPNLGVITQCSSASGDDFWVKSLRSDFDDSNLFLVKGEEGLSCAAKGVVEGEPCDVSQYIWKSFSQTTFVQTDFPGYINAVTASGSLPEVGLKRLYLVRRIGTTSVPGGFEVLAGFFPYRGQNNCASYPIAPAADVQVAKLLEPSDGWCTRSATSCAGARFDERLPLENELAETADGIESSWKYYLERARAAAEESDRLANEYLSSGLSMDQRTETVELQQQAQREKAIAELESLQAICGTSVDTQTLLKAIGDGSTDTGTCTDSTILGAGLVCIAGRQVRVWKGTKPSKNPELKKLMNCVSDFSTRRDAHMGSGSLCFWKKKASGLACDGVPAGMEGHQCPYFPKADTGVCDSVSDSSFEFKVLGPDQGLGWFDAKSTQFPQEPSPGTCDKVRVIRSSSIASSEKVSALKALRDEGIFDVYRVVPMRGALAFQAQYGGYAQLTYGGKRFASSGTPGVWPCSGGTPPVIGCANRPGSFYCSTYDCATKEGRGDANDRMMNAALAFELMTQPPDQVGSIELFYPSANLPQDHVHFEVPFQALALASLVDQKKSPYFVGPTAITEVKNSMIRRYSNVAIPANDPVLFAYRTRGQNYQVQEGLYWFGFKKADSGVISPRANFWNYFHGLTYGDDVESSTAYFSQRAKGVPHNKSLNKSSELTGDAVTLYHGKSYVNSPICNDGVVNTSEELASLNSDLNKQGMHVIVDGYPGVCDNNLAKKVQGLDLVGVEGEVALFDALEMACELQTGNAEFKCGQTPVVNGLDDLEKVSSFLECKGADMSALAARMVLLGVPNEVFNDLKGGDPAAPVQGQMGQAVSELRSSLKSYADSGGEWNRLFRTWAVELRRLKSQLKVKELEDAIEDKGLTSSIANHVTQCATAVAGAFGASSVMSLGGSAVSAAATCGNSVIQSVLASDIANLKKEIHKEERIQLLADMEKLFIGLQDKMAAQALAMQEQGERTQRALASIEDLRDQGRRAIDKALWHSSFVTEKAASIGNVLKANFLTSQLRYRRAHSDAKKLAFLARRAIEQRLGIDLETIRDDLPLVEAPQRWVSNVCSTSPVAYKAVAGGAAKNYADSFIGDYVDKLDAVVESYRLQYGFKEGLDTVVASLRDDIANVRANCLVEGENLLYNAQDFGAADAAKLSSSAWYVDGCPSAGDPNAPYCVSTTEDGTPLELEDGVAPNVPGVRVTFWNGTNCPSGSVCGATSNSMFRQDLSLPPGRYRFSWYERPFNGSAVTTAATSTGKILVNGVAPAIISAESGVKLRTSASWARQYKVFDVTTDSVVSVGFGALPGANSVWVSAPMLEEVDSTVLSSERLPRPFVPTTLSRQILRPECEDSEGGLFRRRWTRGCETLCPEGFGTECGEASQTYCYREYSFYVSQSEIEAGKSFVQSGFARGNFNYRTESIALNFVGTGVRDCEDSNLPSACYSAGFVPYSLYHQGPFRVRNYFGDDFEAHLFPGRIEHARGLATEQYISNPISTSAATQLADFTRLEFQGRPFDGNFVIRIWEEPGVDLDKIEDVQLIMKYRYWTRTQ